VIGERYLHAAAAMLALRHGVIVPHKPSVVREVLGLARSYWVPSDWLHLQLEADDVWLRVNGRHRQTDVRRLFFAPGEIEGREKAIDTSPKRAFIDEIARGLPLEQTGMAQRITAGESVMGRRATPGVRDKALDKIPLTSLEDLRLYYERVQGLIEIIRANGVRPVREINPDDPYVRSGKETDIGLAVLPDGSLRMFRKGRHRLLVARVLGVEYVPCTPTLVSADWVRKHSGSSPPTLRRAAGAIHEYLSSF